MDLASPQFWLAAFEIVVINILLSGDNAVVIALACRNLPRRQRAWGIFWGAIGAIVLRIGLTFFALNLLALPYLKLVGGVLLLYIGVKLIIEEGESGPEVAASDRLLAAVRTVIVADLVMSTDNVLGVAAAAKGSAWLLGFGLLVSIPLVVVGAQMIMRVIERFPILVTAGGGLLGYVAGDMIVEDSALARWVLPQGPWLQWAAPIGGIILVVGLAHWLEGRRLPSS